MTDIWVIVNDITAPNIDRGVKATLIRGAVPGHVDDEGEILSTVRGRTNTAFKLPSTDEIEPAGCWWKVTRGTDTWTVYTPLSMTGSQQNPTLIGDLPPAQPDTPPDSWDAETIGAIPKTEKGAAGGVATLDSDGLVPTTQLPAAHTTITSVTGGENITVTGTSDVTVSAPNVATLADGKIPTEQLPDMVQSVTAGQHITVTGGTDVTVAVAGVGEPDGVASLNSDGKVPATQLPTDQIGGQVDSITGGTGITVDTTDPTSPTVSVSDAPASEIEWDNAGIPVTVQAALDLFQETVADTILPAVTSLGTAATRNVPTSGDAAVDQVPLGNDSRFSDARTPTSHAASHAADGTDPVTVTHTQVSGLGNAATLDVGTTSGTVAAGDALAGKADTDDPRMSDAREPTAHAATHASGGTDPITVTQAQVTGLTDALAGKADDHSTRIKTGTVSTSVEVDVSEAAYQELTLTGNTTVTLTTPPDASMAVTLTLSLIEDSTGGWTVTWPAGVKWMDGDDPGLPTDAGSESVVTLVWSQSRGWRGFVSGVDMKVIS